VQQFKFERLQRSAKLCNKFNKFRVL
jgi:hypothetical protein